MLQADEIRSLIPHAGKMCLLDCVLSHDDEHIECGSTSHTRDDNPLRTEEGLAALHAIEYGAQAMALHGKLAGQAGGNAVVVAARDVEMHVDWLQDILEPLQVTATLMMGDDSAATYRFTVGAGDEMLVEGRLTVAFLRGGSE